MLLLMLLLLLLMLLLLLCPSTVFDGVQISSGLEYCCCCCCFVDNVFVIGFVVFEGIGARDFVSF